MCISGISTAISYDCSMPSTQTTPPLSSDASYRADQFVEAQNRDRYGDVAHGLLAGLFLCSVALGTVPVAIAFGIAGIYAILRIWATYPCYPQLLRYPIIHIMVLTFCWGLISLFWSSDVESGLDELATLRFQLPVLLLAWPILHRRFWLIWSFIAGSGLAFLTQVGQSLEIEWISHLAWTHAGVGRYPGFHHPSGTAIIALVAGVLLIGFAIRAHRMSVRLFSMGVFVCVAASLMMTGSRGPWIAAAMGWGIAILSACFFSMSDRIRPVNKRYALIGMLLLAVAISGIMIVMWPKINTRVTEFQDQINAARLNEQYKSDVGSRLKQVELSIALAAGHPFLGVGAGDYHGAAVAYVEDLDANKYQDEQDTAEQPISSAGRTIPILNHPHSSLLYSVSVLGLPGLLLYLSFWMMLFIMSYRTAYHAQYAYEIVLPAAVIGLFAAFAVDSHHLADTGMISLTLVTILCFKNIKDTQGSNN